MSRKRQWRCDKESTSGMSFTAPKFSASFMCGSRMACIPGLCVYVNRSGARLSARASLFGSLRGLWGWASLDATAELPNPFRKREVENRSVNFSRSWRRSALNCLSSARDSSAAGILLRRYLNLNGKIFAARSRARQLVTKFTFYASEVQRTKVARMSSFLWRNYFIGACLEY